MLYLGKREIEVGNKWLKHLRGVLKNLPLFSVDGDQNLLKDYLGAFERKERQIEQHARKTGSLDLFDLFSFMDEIVRTHRMEKHFNEDAEYSKWEKERNKAKDLDSEWAVDKLVKSIPKVNGFDYWVDAHGDLTVENDTYPNWIFNFTSAANALVGGEQEEYFFEIQDDMGNRMHSERGKYSSAKDVPKIISKALKKHAHARAAKMLKFAKHLLARKSWPKGMKAIDWLIKDFGKFDVEFQDDYYPTKGVLKNRAISDQHDRISEIGKGIVSKAIRDRDGFDIYVNARDREAAIDVLDELLQKAGMKTKKMMRDGKYHSFKVVYNKKRIDEAQRAMQKYHEWIAEQRMR